MTNNFLIFTGQEEVHSISAREGTCINILKPIQCRQKEFVYSLQTSH